MIIIICVIITIVILNYYYIYLQLLRINTVIAINNLLSFS